MPRSQAAKEDRRDAAPLVLQLCSLRQLLALCRGVPPRGVIGVPPAVQHAVPGGGGGPRSQAPAFLVLLQIVLQRSELVLQDLRSHNGFKPEALLMPYSKAAGYSIP